MQYDDGEDDYTNGPSGKVRTAARGDWHKLWGSITQASDNEEVAAIGLTRVIAGTGSRGYKMCCINLLNAWSEPGDSDALVAYSGRGKRDVAGVAFAYRTEPTGDGQHIHVRGTYYIPANDIITALGRVGHSISHYWGTKTNYRAPATKACDDPDGCWRFAV